MAARIHVLARCTTSGRTARTEGAGDLAGRRASSGGTGGGAGCVGASGDTMAARQRSRATAPGRVVPGCAGAASARARSERRKAGIGPEGGEAPDAARPSALRPSLGEERCGEPTRSPFRSVAADSACGGPCLGSHGGRPGRQTGRRYCADLGCAVGYTSSRSDSHARSRCAWVSGPCLRLWASRRPHWLPGSGGGGPAAGAGGGGGTGGTRAGPRSGAA
jgi:hypothetical protein